MNEEYLKGYFNSYVKPKKSDAVYEDWVAKISTNEEYKRGMFNTYVKPQKADAIYEDWNTKIFGTTQPTVEQKKNTPVPTQNKVAETKENKGFSFEQLTSGASGIAGIDKSAADNNSDKTVKPALNVQSVVETNLGVPFINRIVKPDLYEPIKNADGTVSTHKLAYAESDGKFVVFPTIQENDTQDALIDLSKNDKDIEKAYNRAIKNKDFLEFDTEEDARQFAEGAWKDVYKGYESAPEYGKFVKEVTPRRMQVMADMPTQQSEISVDYEQERNFWKSEEGQQLSNELKYFNNKQRLYGDGGKYEGYVGGLVRKADEIMTGSIAGNLWMMLNSIQLNPTATGASIDIDATMKNYRSWYGQLAEDINTAKTKEVSEDSEFTSKFRELSMLWMTMAADVPVFGAIGKAAACATMAVGDLFAPIVKATPKFEKLLTPIVKQTLASSSTMGATLGMYEGGMDIANQLGTKPLNEFNYEQNLKSFGHGYATGVAVGGTMGLTNFARSKMLSSMYEKLVMTGKTGNMPLNVANNMAKAIGFGAEATVFSNASTLLDEGRFSTIDEIVNTAVELAVIKSTQPTAFMPKNNLISVVEGMTPEKVGKGRFNVDYNDYEKTLDVKLFDEKGNLNGKELKDAISNDVPLTYIQKRLWERGIMLNMSAKTYDVGVEELDGKYYVRLTDKVGKTISLEQYADKAEADANAVTAAYMVRDRKVFESFAELSATDKAEVDANFNGDKELLRQAWGKNPFERNNYEKEVINEFKNVVDKQVAEKDKKEQSKQKENDTKDEAGLSGEVGKGQEPIETKPIEETGGKEVETSGNVQAPEKEIAELSKETQIPLNVLTDANDAFRKSQSERKLTEAEAGQEARKSMERSEWFNSLNETERADASRKMDDVIERFTDSPLRPKQRIKAAEKSPAMEATQTLKNKELMGIIKDTAARATKSIGTLISDVKKLIKDAKDNGKLTDAEHTAILSGIEKVAKGRENFETKKQALLDYVETKLIGAEMRQDVQTARANIAKLRGNVRNKRNFYGDRFNQVKEATNIDLNTTDAETIKQYNDIVSEFLKIAKKPTKEQIDKFTKDIAELEFTPTEKKVKTKEDLDKYVEKASATEVTDAKSFRTALNQVRRAKSMAKKLESEGKITEAELTDVMDKVETNSDSIASKLKDKEVEIKKDLTKEIDETVKDIVKELAKGNDLGLNEYELADIKKAIIKLKSKAVKKNMTVADADLIAYAMSNIKDGFINGDTFDAINKISTFEQYGKWREVYENIRDSRRFRQLEGYKQGVKIPFTQKVIKTKGETNRNTDQTAVAVINSKDSHRLGQYFGSLGHGLMEAFVGTTTRNIGTAKKYIAKLSNESGFNEASKNLRGSFFKKNFNKTGYDNSKRNIAFILTERMYQSNEKTTDHKNYWDAVIERMNISKAKNPKQFERDKAAWETMKKDKSLWNSDGSLNVEEAYKRLTPAEKKYYDSIIRLNEKMEQLMKYATEKNGRRYVALNNYDFFHIIREKDVGTEDKNEPKKVKDIVASFMPATKPAGSTFERNMTPKYINTDLDVVIREQIKEANYDVFVARDFLANQRAIDMIKKDIGKEGTIGYKVFDAFQQSAKKRLVIEQNKQLIDDANRVANNVISLFSKKVLAIPTRVINELVTNLERQFLGQGKFDVAINKTDKQAYGDLMSDYIHNTKDYGNYSEYYGDSKTKAGKSVEWLLTFSDKSVVPMTFKTEFDKVFKRETGKAFDAESYNNDYMYRYKMSEAIEKASMAAIARSEELFNVKTPLGASPNLMFYKIMGKTASAERSSPLAKSLFFLQSFNHNELNQVKRAGLKFVNGVKEKDAGLIRMGIVDLFAISASNLTYLMIGRALREMSKPLFAYIFSGGDKDDVIGDIDENMAKFMEENMTEKALTGQIAASLYSLSLGKYGAMTPALSGMLLGTLKKQVDKGDEEYDKTYAGLEDLAEQAYVRPIDINGYGSVTSFAKSLNPVISEVIVGLETLQMGVDEGIKAVREDEDVDTVNLIIFLNSVFNYAMLNPMTNYVDKQLRYYKRIDDKVKKEEKKNERSGSKREGDKREPDERKGIYR